MTTTQKESLPSSSRTLFTPCSLMPVSSLCSGTQLKGGSEKKPASSDMHAAAFVPPSWLFIVQIQTDTLPVYRQQKTCGHRRCVALYSVWLSHKFHYDAFIRRVESLLLDACKAFASNWGLLYAVNVDFYLSECLSMLSIIAFVCQITDCATFLCSRSRGNEFLWRGTCLQP